MAEMKCSAGLTYGKIQYNTVLGKKSNLPLTSALLLFSGTT